MGSGLPWKLPVSPVTPIIVFDDRGVAYPFPGATSVVVNHGYAAKFSTRARREDVLKSMNNLIFISYRRDDTALVARALAETLRYRFGANRIFLDEDSIREGGTWSERLKVAVTRANVVLALIGPNWLTTSDKYGRRRLDIEEDWVRKELMITRSQGVEVLPVLIGEGTSPPPKEGLPDALTWLSEVEVKRLHNDAWHEGVSGLVTTLIEQYGFIDIQRGPVLPVPGIKKREELPLSDEVLAQELEQLEGWEPVQTTYPPRREIRKMYHFKSFQAAIEFMCYAVPSIEAKPVHHPRWENQYRAVTVYFSTWDAGSKVTRYDIDAARMMDTLYRSFSKSDAP
jgi:pterin-4a-carbinolamine dehydratase